MSLSQKIALNTAIQLISKVISTALGLVTIAVMTRYLSPVGFGQYTTITTFLSFFAVAADLGLTLVTVQMISQPGADENRTLSNLMSLRLVTAISFIIIAPAVIFFFPYNQTVKLGVMVSTFAFLFPALNQILVGLFQKHLRLDKVSIAEIVSRLILTLGVIATARFDYGLYGILIVSVLSSLASFMLHYFFSLKLARIKLNFDYRVWAEIIKRSWPIGLTIVFNLIYLRADTLILSLFKSEAEVGIYGATYKVIDVLITLPFIYAGIVLPIMTSSWLLNRERFRLVMQKSFDLMVILAVPLTFGTQVLASPVMTLVAGPEFAVSGEILKILIMASSIIFMGTVFSHGVIAIDKQKKIIPAYAFTAITALIGYLVFIPPYSYFGAAWVTIYSELAIALASAYIVWKYSDFRPNAKILLKALLASLVMVLIIRLTDDLNLLAKLLLAITSYFVALYAFRGVTKADLVTLFGK